MPLVGYAAVARSPCHDGSMSDTAAAPKGPLGHWNAIPLYIRILIALILGIGTGVWLGDRAAFLEIPSTVILQLLGALAPPLILIAVTHVLMTTDIRGRTAGRLAWLLILNTSVAVAIGLTVANLMQPGKGADLQSDEPVETESEEGPDPFELFRKNLPKSILGPLGDNQNIIGVIIIAVAFGIALRGARDKPVGTIREFVEILYDALLVMLHWIIHLIPIGVFAIVAGLLATRDSNRSPRWPSSSSWC